MNKRRKRCLLVWSSILIGVPLIWIVGLSLSISRAGSLNPDAKGDVAIVLGAAVWEEKPSPVFKSRIDHAIWLLEQGNVKSIIFTGGNSPEDHLSEAEAARGYALSRGVLSDAIFLEKTSKSTFENLLNAKGIMHRLGVRRAVIVSDPFHLLRAGMLAGRLGIVHELSPTPSSRYQGFAAKTSQLTREAYYTTRLMLTGT